MKKKSTIVALAMLAAIGAGISTASATPAIQIKLEYIGSTTGLASGGGSLNKIAQNSGSGLALSTTNSPGGSLSTITAGLTQYDLKTVDQSTPNLKNYLAMYVKFTPDVVDQDYIYGFAADINFPTGMAPVTGTNVSDTTTNKFLAWNLIDGWTSPASQVWNQQGDLGALAGDLKGVTFYQDSANTARQMYVGQPLGADDPDSGYITGKGTLLGVFALKFNTTGVSGDVSITALPANVAWYSSDGPHYDNSVFSANSIAVGATATPEPASLGVLALGGLALLARRRK